MHPGSLARGACVFRFDQPADPLEEHDLHARRVEHAEVAVAPWLVGPFMALGTLRPMKMLRRAIVALSMAGAIFATLRMRGKGGVPPQAGGWREVDVPPR